MNGNNEEIEAWQNAPIASENSEASEQGAQHTQQVGSATQAQAPAGQQEDNLANSPNAELLMQNFAQQAEEYCAEQPDFMQAFDFLLKMRDQQLQHYSNLYPHLANNEARQQQLEKEALEILDSAEKNGANAAQFFYQLAQQFGYSKAGNKQKQQWREAAQTLTASGGAAAALPMTPEALATMSQADFDEWYWKNKQQFRKIMGA